MAIDQPSHEFQQELLNQLARLQGQVQQLQGTLETQVNKMIRRLGDPMIRIRFGYVNEHGEEWEEQCYARCWVIPQVGNRVRPALGGKRYEVRAVEYLAYLPEGDSEPVLIPNVLLLETADRT
jgi:hypothetical protein